MTTELVPLRYLAELNPETLDESTDPSRLFRYVDIGATGRGRLTGEPVPMTFAESPSRARRVIRSGDTVLSTVRTYLRAVWTLRGAEEDLVASTGFVCLRPRREVDPRYLGWLAESDVVVEEVVARSVGVSYPAINPSEVGLIKVPLPPLDEQRTIADYLDRETARIDALIAAKERIRALLSERFDAAVSRVMWTGSLPRIRLKFLTNPPTSGNRDHASFTSTDEGVPCLRGLNVRPRRIDRDNLLRISPEDHTRHRASRLRAGDVVIVRSGLAGSAAVIPDDLDDCNCVDLVIVRRSDRLVSRYLEYVTNSREAREQVAERSVGALLTHFNAMDAADLSVPIRSVDSQRVVVAELDQLRDMHERLTRRLDRQSSLLREHRQALISAAITGQIEVAVAA